MDHEEASRLLPWLVNGTLADAEREQIERHVHDCLACRAELREQQGLRMLVQRHPDVHFSAEQGFADLARQLAAPDGAPSIASDALKRRDSVDPVDPLERPERGELPGRAEHLGRPEHLGRLGSPERLGRLERFAHGATALFGAHRLVVANAAALALIAGVAIWLSAQRPADEAAYSTLTQAPALDGAQLDVVFAPGTTQEAVHELLGAIDGTIVAGPSAVGRYTVRLAGSPSDAELDAVIGGLLADPRVRFAGRAFIGQGP